MNGFARQTWLVTCNELSDALRSRRAAVVLLLYLAASVLFMYSVLGLLQNVENEVAGVLQIPTSSQAGAVTEALWKSDRFRQGVEHATGNSGIVVDLMSTSPVVLIYAMLVFLFTPMLVMLVASGRVADELASGSARYVLVRTSRLSWSVGKYLGQAALMAVALLLSGVGAWCVARLRMMGANGLEIALGMVLWSLRAWVYSLGFLGLALGVSHLTRSGARATILALLALIAMTILAAVADHRVGAGWRQLWYLAIVLTPQGHRFDLWRSSAAHLVPAVLYMVALGAGYLLAGYAIFRRRDL